MPNNRLFNPGDRVRCTLNNKFGTITGPHQYDGAYNLAWDEGGTHSHWNFNLEFVSCGDPLHNEIRSYINRELGP